VIQATKIQSDIITNEINERKGITMENSHKFYSNRSCKYFPCHKGVREEEFNCLFCYCPLYFLGDKCGGNFRMVKGIKDCSQCTIPHAPGGYEKILERIREENRHKREE